MAFDNRRRKNIVGYGVGSPLIDLSPLPVVAQRAPTASDFAELGTVWVDEPANDVYILASIAANSAMWVSVGGGTPSFDSLTVTNTITSTNGDVVSGGDITATGAVSGASIAATGSELTTAPASATVASPTDEATTNGATFKATFTGFTTAASGSQVLTINNTSITPGEGIILTVHNTATANDCLMELTGFVAAAGAVDVTVSNVGSQALDGDIIITGWVVE